MRYFCFTFNSALRFENKFETISLTLCVSRLSKTINDLYFQSFKQDV